MVFMAPCGHMDQKHYHRLQFNSTRDPDVALSSSTGLGNTMALGVSICHTNLHGSRATWLLDINMATGGGLDPGYPYGLWQQHGPWKSTQIPAKVRDLDMALASSLSLDVTMALGGTISHPRPLPLLLPFWLFPQHMNCSAFLPLPFLHHIVAHVMNGACPPGTSRVSLPSPGLDAPGGPQSYQYLNDSVRPVL